MTVNSNQEANDLKHFELVEALHGVDRNLVELMERSMEGWGTKPEEEWVQDNVDDDDDDENIDQTTGLLNIPSNAP